MEKEILTQREQEQKASDLLSEKGLTIGEKMFIMQTFRDSFKNEYPFIKQRYEKGTPSGFYSTLKGIDNMVFDTEKTAILANAIYENTKENFNCNEFIFQLKAISRILGIKNNWSE